MDNLQRCTNNVTLSKVILKNSTAKFHVDDIGKGGRVVVNVTIQTPSPDCESLTVGKSFDILVTTEVKGFRKDDTKNEDTLFVVSATFAGRYSTTDADDPITCDDINACLPLLAPPVYAYLRVHLLQNLDMMELGNVKIDWNIPFTDMALVED